MRMTVVLAGPLDHRHAYLQRMITALSGLGHAVTVIDAVASGAADADRPAETVAPHDVLLVDSSAMPALDHMAHRYAPGRAALFIRETPPAEGIAKFLPQLGPVIVTAESARQRLGSELALLPERIQVVEPGIDPDLPRSRGPADADGCAILATDPVWPRSDYRLLLRALARLTDLNWTLMLAANASASPVIAQAGEYEIAERLHVLDPHDASALERAWRDAGLYVVATDDAGDGLVISEALRRGVPVAVAGGPGIKARVPGAAGAIAGPGEHAALSTAMRRLIFDAPLRREMGEAAWQLGRTLPTWEAQARRFADALEE